MNNKKVGAAGEEQAAKYLESQGMVIVQRNFRCRQGEIDIVGTHRGYLVFVEVKYRKGRMSGMPEEAVDFHKKRKICRVSDYYRFRKECDGNQPFRFDVVAVEENSIRWYQNAFDYIY